MRVVHLFLIDTLLSTTAVQFGSRVSSEVGYGDTILAGKYRTLCVRYLSNVWVVLNVCENLWLIGVEAWLAGVCSLAGRGLKSITGWV